MLVASSCMLVVSSSTGREAGRVRIGTSGWSYGHWREVLYPRGVSARDFLPLYATHFPTVEVNSSFYHLPRSTTVAHWVAVTPSGFCFAVKASSYITYRLRLTRCEQPLAAFLEIAGGFGQKLGPILFQLPPGLHCDLSRLREFISLLPAGLRCAFEFRHKSWYQDGVFTLLSQHHLALCIHDLHGSEAPLEVTAPFVYLRLHGPQRAYTGSYGPEALESWAKIIGGWTAAGRDVYVYFNNDIGGYAVQNARELTALVGGPTGDVTPETQA